MEVLQSIFESTQLPVFSAFILGLMTAISPCPLVTNITAIGFIGKDIKDKKRVFLNGVFYTLGRAISYMTIGLIFYFGIGEYRFSGFLQTWGEKIIGPVLVLIGVFMLDLIKINIPWSFSFAEKMEGRAGKNYRGVILLGMLFALAFCPYSGVLFFGMLIPLSISSTNGFFLPLVFALGTGIPVIVFSWIIAYSIGSVGIFYNRLKVFETWFRRVIALLFIGVGIYFIITFFL